MTNLFDNSKAPKQIPKTFVRGDYVAWRNTSLVSDYPVASYRLEFNFRREGESAGEFTVVSSVDAGEYLFEITGATSGGIESGRWYWDLYVFRLSDEARVTVGTGAIQVLRNSAEDADDPRSEPARILALIEAAILHRATQQQLDTLSYTLGVETSATRDPAQLMTWRDYYEKKLAIAKRKWRARRGLPHSGRVTVRF